MRKTIQEAGLPEPKFEFTTFSESLNVIKPRYGREPLVNIIDQLNSMKITGQSKLKESLESYKQHYVRSKSLLVLVSDFWYDPKDIEEILIRYKKSKVYLVQVLDPMEVEVALRGDVLLEDLESNFLLRTFISNRFREKYKARLHEHILELQDLADRYHANFVTLKSDDPIFDSVYSILYDGKKH